MDRARAHDDGDIEKVRLHGAFNHTGFDVQKASAEAASASIAASR